VLRFRILTYITFFVKRFLTQIGSIALIYEMKILNNMGYFQVYAICFTLINTVISSDHETGARIRSLTSGCGPDQTGPDPTGSDVQQWFLNSGFVNNFVCSKSQLVTLNSNKTNLISEQQTIN
jgi:hypothetical protein